MRFVLFFVFMFIASIYDLKTRVIPDRIHICIILLCLIPPVSVYPMGLLAALPLLLIGMLSGGIGGGDIKIVAASGLILGLHITYMGVMIGYILFIVMYMVLKPMISREKKMNPEEKEQGYPLVPFLALGMLFSIII